MAIGGLEE